MGRFFYIANYFKDKLCCTTPWRTFSLSQGSWTTASGLAKSVWLIFHLKSSVRWLIFGRKVCWGTNLSNWNHDLWNTLKLHWFIAECHQTISAISGFCSSSGRDDLTACVQTPLAWFSGSTLNQSSREQSLSSKLWSKRNHTRSWAVCNWIPLKVQCTVSKSLRKTSRFCWAVIGRSLRNLINSGFFCQWATCWASSFKSSLCNGSKLIVCSSTCVDGKSTVFMSIKIIK